jgi:eukaryotic-like serine/threonine-protein kinase
MPADPLEIELDSDDLVAEPEERTTSQTRRLGSNAQAAIELDIKEGVVAAPAMPDVVPIDEVTPAVEDGKPPAKPYLPGDVISQKYKLTRIIGRGGMGAVWQAHNIALDIDVAVKLIRRDRAAPVAADRLLTEARAAARLMHPAIVRVFDFGETSEGDPFIVMELLHGESLAAILRRKKRLSPAVAVQTLLPVAGALASAHAKGIVHRDLKPDNIIVVTDENGALVPKIVDFGIAKLLSPELDRQVTVAGEVLGSPDYMSPEQARGSDTIGEATDVWTFSVVLYELMTGKRPFDGPNYNALIASILTNAPRPLLSHGVGDAALSGILDHGLAKDVSARWPRIRDMGAALASWAVANGVEDDLMGRSIAKQWLTSGARRLLTVLPETGGPALRSGTVPQPGALPLHAAAPTISRQTVSRQPAAAGARRASAQRALLLVIVIVLLGALGVTVFLLGDWVGQLRGATAPSTTARPTAAAGVTAPVTAVAAPVMAPVTAAITAAVMASVMVPDPTPPAVTDTAAATAEPPTSGSARTSPGKLLHRPKAPAAPKNIRF